MPGVPLLNITDSYQGVAGEGTGMLAPPAGAQSHGQFILWLIVLGVIVPAVILGGLRAGGFQFVFRRR